MGHANRPRLHDAIGLDAQSRCLCFPSACWCAESNTNCVAECYTYGHGNSYAYTNSYAYGNSNSYAHAECYAYGYANRQLPGNLYDSYCHRHDNRRRHRYRQPLR